MKKLFLFLLLSISFSHSSVADLTEENFESIIKKNNKSIVMFASPYCGPCLVAKPIYLKISNKFEGNIKFFLINTDKEKKLSRDNNIEFVPTIIIFENGKEVKRKSGLSNKFRMEMFIDPLKTIKEEDSKCMDGNRSSCMELAEFYKINGDYSKTVIYSKKSCELNADSCSYIAEIYYHGEIVKQDYEKAIEFYKKACSRGNIDACRNIGFMYDKGEGIAINHEKAVKFYREACKGKDTTACYMLAYSYERGIGIKKDYIKSLKFYKLICKSDFSSDYDTIVNACTQIGDFYRDGKGVTKDSKQAFKFYEKSCTYNNHDGCRNLGNMYKSGLGVEKNIKKAIEFYGRACELDDKGACTEMKKLKSEEK